ncbi:stalk domain-containing protein [Marinisporobacter balticus]|uniref:Outer membrane protein TolC n=1 Tax=Marinisporobacter balticus TaxID=2018667 RepID=A0A4V2SCB5_9FIRM|nr:stalk domain-containing protein [Marinisporobacter balticus]TCO78770.1 outer membrane protein TolC [Marinisporobacter balticus]
MDSRLKKISIGATIFTLFMGSIAVAEDVSLMEVKFTIGQPKYQIGATEKNIDVIPYIKNGRTMLPIKYAAEVIGVDEKDITWDEKSKTVTLFKDNSIIQMTVGNKILVKNGKQMVMEAAPEIMNGRTMLPVSYIAKALDIEIKWNSIQNTITVVTQKDIIEPTKEKEITWDYNYDQLLEKALKSNKDLRKTKMLLDKAEELKDDATQSFESVNEIPSNMTSDPKVAGKKNLVYRNYRGQQIALNVAEKDVETMKEKIAYDVKNAYYNVLKSEKTKKLAALGLEIKREKMNHANLKYEQSMTSEFEKNKAKRDYEEAKKTYEMSQKALDLVYEGLNYSVGFKPEERYILEDHIVFDEIPEVDLNLNTHIPTMINKSPQIWALEQKIDLAQLGLDLFVFNSDGDYEATKIDRNTLDVDLSSLKEAYEENLRKLHTGLETLEKKYESTQIALEKAQEDLKVEKLNYAVGNGIALQVKVAEIQVEELKNKRDEIIMEYNDKATLYQKPWLALSK